MLTALDKAHIAAKPVPPKRGRPCATHGPCESPLMASHVSSKPEASAEAARRADAAGAADVTGSAEGASSSGGALGAALKAVAASGRGLCFLTYEAS